MSKLQEYLKLKKVKKEFPQKIWISISNREGVSEPEEFQITGKDLYGYSHKDGNKIPIYKYTIQSEQYPFNVKMTEGEPCNSESSYGSGFGDLWSSTIFCSFDKNLVDRFYKEETKRVKKNYQMTDLTEDDLEIYDVYKSANGNLFIKITNEYSIALGPKEDHQPYDIDLNSTQYVKRNNVHRLTKVGRIEFNDLI